jgi:hypothetical protein
MVAVSIAVSLDQLRHEVARRGDAAFVVTTGDDGPHVVSVRIGWDADELVAGAGNRTTANLAARPVASLLWPSSFDDYSLIVDGTASAVDGSLRITPVRAVLHRSAAASGDGPGCITSWTDDLQAATTAAAVPRASRSDGAHDEDDEKDDEEQTDHALTVPHIAGA